jgi:NNP family nitrate/nitrite transporter-like MFS transporter
MRRGEARAAKASAPSAPRPSKALAASTVAFTACFAVWTIFSIVGIQLKDDLGLDDVDLGLLMGIPILVGSLIRLGLGVLADRHGGRLVYTITMLAAAAATFFSSFAQTFPEACAAALGIGIAGGSFAVGVAYVSRFYPPERQGTALGLFGLGNVGAAVTTFAAPFVMVALGWQATTRIWAAVLAAIAVAFYLLSEDEPVARAAGARRDVLDQLACWRDARVWRLALYYFFAFGGFVALALWLPRYLISVYALDIKLAGVIGSLYSLTASMFRALGGALADRFGAQRVSSWTLAASAAATAVLSMPATDYVAHGVNGASAFHLAIGLAPFAVIALALGFFMSLGMAAVFKHVPAYYPDNVGAVGGLVGAVGGLGGFFLPVAFGWLLGATGLWTSCFMLLFALVALLFAWTRLAVRATERQLEARPA